jgi:hypothetical protein
MNAILAENLRDLNDSKYWRDRATEMRALAEAMKDPEAARIMRLADDYNKLADRAKQGSRSSGKLSPLE